MVGVYGGYPVVFWAGRLRTGPALGGEMVVVTNGSPAVFGPGQRFWVSE